MKKTDYRNALNKIKVSEDFRKKLTEKLEAEPQSSDEYADSVFHVEKAQPKKSGIP